MGKLRTDNLANKLGKLLFFIGTILFAAINVSIFVHYGDISYRGNLRFEFNPVLLSVFSVVLLGCLVFITHFLKRMTMDHRAKCCVLVVMTILHFFILLIIGNELANEPGWNWDEGFSFYNALNLLNGERLSGYFIAYPAGLGTFAVDIFIICLGKLLGFTEVMQYARVAVFLSAVAIEVTVLICANVIKNVLYSKGDNKNSGCVEFLPVFISYLFIPYYFYQLLYYSDTYSLLFVALLTKAYSDYCVKRRQDKSTKTSLFNAGIIVIIAFIGAKIKATLIIVLIAIILSELVNKNFKFVIGSCSIYIGLSLLFSGFLSSINDIVPTKENEEYNDKKFPYTMYIEYGWGGGGFW